MKSLGRGNILGSVGLPEQNYFLFWPYDVYECQVSGDNDYFKHVDFHSVHVYNSKTVQF